MRFGLNLSRVGERDGWTIASVFALNVRSNVRDPNEVIGVVCMSLGVPQSRKLAGTHPAAKVMS